MKISRCGQAEPLTEKTFLQLYQELDRPHKFILALTWYCAERAGAICQLKRADCFDHRGQPLRTIVIGRSLRKDKVTKEVPVTSKLRSILLQIPKTESEWLFPAPKDSDRPIPFDTYQKAFQRACDRLGLVGYSTHSARRGAITHLVRQGINLRIVQKISGHASLTNLARYADVSSVEVERSLALL